MSEGISVERQIYLLGRYGVPESTVTVLRNKEAEKTARDEAVRFALSTLTNAFLHSEVAADDLQDVSVLIGYPIDDRDLAYAQAIDQAMQYIRGHLYT